jgi:signal transduction histidine kinase
MATRANRHERTPQPGEPPQIPVPPRRAIEDELPYIFESLPLGVFIFDYDLRILLRNSAGSFLLPDGDNLAEALARFSNTFPFKDWSKTLRDVLDTGRPRLYDGLLLSPPGEPDRYLNLTCSPLRVRQGIGSTESSDPLRFDAGLLVVEDVTARITMERRLAVSERLAAVGKMCATVAHELNNPLDGILRYLSLALRQCEDESMNKVASYLQQSRDGAMRMVQVTRSLLEFSRSAPRALEDAGVNKLVEEAVRTMEAHTAKGGIAVVCNYRREPMPSFHGCNLYQVFCNLIKNAVDAMPNGGTLTITTGLDNAHILVTMEDTGPGLPDDADRIFEPFFTTKPAGAGTGLGLAVCREIVEKYGGTITAANRRDGAGAVFAVRIPTNQTREAAQSRLIERCREAAVGASRR